MNICTCTVWTVRYDMGLVRCSCRHANVLKFKGERVGSTGTSENVESEPLHSALKIRLRIELHMSLSQLGS